MVYLSNNTVLKYICYITFSLWFFNTAYIPNLNFIVALVLAVSYIYYDWYTSSKNTQDINIELNYKLNSLLYEEGKKVPKYFYTEPDLILFFYNIKEYRIYNRDSYVKAIKTADHLLRIRQELQNDYFYIENDGFSSWQNFGYTKRNKKLRNIKNLREINDIAISLAKKSINYMHSFAVSLPSHFKNKHQESLDRYHLLIKRLTDEVYFHCKKYSDNPLLTQDYGLPKAYEEVNRFDFFT
jgi:hypothetical protein